MLPLGEVAVPICGLLVIAPSRRFPYLDHADSTQSDTSRGAIGRFRTIPCGTMTSGSSMPLGIGSASSGCCRSVGTRPRVDSADGRVTHCHPWRDRVSWSPSHRPSHQARRSSHDPHQGSAGLWTRMGLRHLGCQGRRTVDERARGGGRHRAFVRQAGGLPSDEEEHC